MSRRSSRPTRGARVARDRGEAFERFSQAEVTQTDGRVAPMITSDSAQWVASAQGESIDNSSPRGRAALRAADAITEAERRSGTRPAYLWKLWSAERRVVPLKVSPAADQDR